MSSAASAAVGPAVCATIAAGMTAFGAGRAVTTARSGGAAMGFNAATTSFASWEEQP